MKGRSMKIFYLDDDSEELELFREALEESDPSIRLCGFTDCHTALNELPRMECLDLIFLDFNMPVMNGEECLRRIKLMPEVAHIPVIIYSTGVYPELRQRLMSKGAAMVIQKHDSPIALRKFIRSHFMTASD